MNGGYSICFNEWALDKEIKNELGLLLIISSLTAEKGYCYASNEYFSKLLDIPSNSISIKIKKLEKKGYINIIYQKRGCEVISREIRLSKIQIDDIRKFKSTILENSKENNISINNINIKESIKEKYFENEELNNIFHEFIEMRKKLKAINSERAINSLLKILEPYDDETKILIIEQSIVNSWKGLFKLKTNKEKIKPNWLNKEIINQEIDKQTKDEFNNFIQEFRNER